MLPRLYATVILAIRRLLSQKGLTTATLLGLTVSVALTMSIPLYADAVYYRVLVQELKTGGDQDQALRLPQIASSWARPPFSFLFRYLGTLQGSLQWEQVMPADAYLTSQAPQALGLPVKQVVRHFRTRPFKLYAPSQVDYTGVAKPIASTSFATISGMSDHITLVEGGFPMDADSHGAAPCDVLVSEAFATRFALRTGQTYAAYTRGYVAGGDENIELPVRIAGIWKAVDPGDGYWFYHPSALADLLILPESTFRDRISPAMGDEISVGLWYLVMDGSHVHAADISPLFIHLTRTLQQASVLLPNIELDPATIEALDAYRRNASVLTVLLYAFAIPILGLAMAFVGMVMGLSVERRRNEIAVMRSRGASMWQVVGVAVEEVVLLGVLALAWGALLGTGLMQCMGQARSFMSFEAAPGLRPDVTPAAWRAGVGALGFALLAQALPTLGAARHTIVTFKQERARLLRPPWWQRAGLDLILLIPVVYGIYLLRRQGTIALPSSGGDAVSDPFQNPLLFFVPVLGVCALTLFLLRVLPFAMAMLAWLVAHSRSVSVYLAARQLSRSPGFYAAPLVLLVLTVSLAAFTASLAQTLDRDLHDRSYYQVGSDLSLVEFGEEAGETAANPAGAKSSASGSEMRWLFLPVSEHLRAPGVQAAARVGRYPAVTRLSGSTQTGTFVGIDRLDFPKVAFWRRDFSPARLGTLMNLLAGRPDAVLLSRDFMARHGLEAGAMLRVQVETFGQLSDLDLQIVGAFDLFPTWYASDGPLFVGNLDHLFEAAGSEFPYDVWLKIGLGADLEGVVKVVRMLGLRVTSWDAPSLRIAAEQRRPERQGLFGLLSVGFVAAALLTVAGFLVYALFSFRRRFIEFGILRAVGLRTREMTSCLAWELSFLILTGVAAGTLMGIWASRLFIPFLQVGAERSRIPPFQVEIAWRGVFGVYALFVLLFLIACGVLALLLSRMQIFQAVKLGETT